MDRLKTQRRVGEDGKKCPKNAIYTKTKKFLGGIFLLHFGLYCKYSLYKKHCKTFNRKNKNYRVKITSDPDP